MEKHLKEMPAEFKTRILNYRRWQDVQLSILGRLQLLTGLKRLGIRADLHEISYNEYSKPVFKDCPVRFSISHSENLVVCALSLDAREIGIDIEFISEIQTLEFKNHLTQREWNQLISSHDKISTFYKYWTKKESILKAYGKGILIPLNSLDVTSDWIDLHNIQYNCKEIKIDPFYQCHVASSRDLDEIPIELSELTLSHLNTPYSFIY
ncbi:MAG: 4'-phosphopantetheinyl transferase family protein [Cyclobacteriaceae bacterium]